MESTPRFNSLPENDPTLLDLAAVLLRRWRLILLTSALVGAAFLVYGLLQPKRYTSRVVLVPSGTGGGDMRAQLLASQLKMPGLGSMGTGNSSQLIVQAILKSASLKDSVVERVGKSMGPAKVDRVALRRILREGVSIETDPAIRSVAIDVNASDPKLAAVVAENIPEAINTIAAQLSLQASMRRREGLERQLDVARSRLAVSEDRLRRFQERHGFLPEIQEQARRTVNDLAELRQKVSEQEVKVSMLRRSATEDNPQYRAALDELAVLRRQTSAVGRGNGDNLLLSRSAMPELKLELGRLMRENLKDEQVYLSFTAEMAGVQADVGNDMTVVTVLDRPAVPVDPSGPRLSLLVAAGLLLGSTMGIVWALLANYMVRARALSPHEPFFTEWDRVRKRVRVARSREA